MSRCDTFFKNIDDLKIISKDSGSSTIIATAIARGCPQPIILKISFQPVDPLNNSLKVEEQIYKNIISYLLVNNFTPHLVEYITTINDCGDVGQRLTESEKTKYYSRIDNINYANDYDIYRSFIIVMTKSQGITLENMIDKNISEDLLFIIIFQVIYTLACFERVMLVHNDLHFGNIFVDKLDKAEIYQYHVNDKNVRIKTEYSALIYDFDRAGSYHPAVERNMTLDRDFCGQYKQCNYPGSLQDLQSILAFFILYQSKKEINYPSIYKWCLSVSTPKFIKNVQKREYSQSGERYSNKGYISSLNVCLDSLILELEKRGLLYKDKNNIDRSFKLPPQRNIVWGKKVSKITHPAVQVSLSKYTIDVVNDKIKTFFSKLDYLDEIWIEESKLIGYDVKKNTEDLFKTFIEKKPISSGWMSKYLWGCYMLNIPFFDKMTNEAKKALFKKKALESIGDIYNTFGNILPMEMPLL